MKEDLRDISDLVRHFVSQKKFPERKLVIETLDQRKVSAVKDANLRELRSFVSEVRKNSATLPPTIQSTGVVTEDNENSLFVDASMPLNWQNEWSEYFSAPVEGGCC